jgi:hypothetical protein
MSAISGDRSHDYEVPNTKRARQEDKKSSKINKKVKQSLTENQPDETQVKRQKGTAAPILKKRTHATEEKKTVRVHAKVRHHQLFGKIGRHERYVKRVTTNILPLVDESWASPVKKKSDISFTQAVEALEKQKAAIAEWKQLEKDKRPRGDNPVGERTNVQLTEKELTGREPSSIRRSSPSWQEVNLESLYQSAYIKLVSAGTPVTPQTLKMQMVVDARLQHADAVQFRLNDLKGIYYSLNSPNTPPDAAEQLDIPETTLLPELMEDLEDLISIEKNEDHTFTVTYCKISPRDIQLFLKHTKKLKF